MSKGRMNTEYIYKSERSWPNKRFSIGAIVGHTTSTSCRLWIRTASPGDYILIVYPKAEEGGAGDLFEGFKAVPYEIGKLPGNVKQIPFKVENFDKDTTDVLDLVELLPDTEYCYAVYSTDAVGEEDRIILGQDRRHSFKTMPDKEQPYSFAFFSCNMPYKVGKNKERDLGLSNEEMWGSLDDTLKRHSDKGLRFIIGGGDQVYTDGVDHKEINLQKNLNTRMEKKNGELTPTKDEMVLWYRDIYRGYWGIRGINRIFSSYPTYMIWDDHEIWDGWGSYILSSDKDDELHSMFPIFKDKEDVEQKQLKAKGLDRKDLLTLKDRMFEAAKQVYYEYQHSHNPGIPGQYDYDLSHGEKSAFYFFDGRGERDVNRGSNCILGKAQLDRFKAWLESTEIKKKKVVFVVSAVPVLHVATIIANSSELTIVEKRDLQDDLRDSWENKRHKKEREELMAALFKAADDGQKVVILSGDVHIAAAFKITNGKSVIHQLTSSAITYNIPLWESYLFSVLGVPDDGETEEGYRFKRLALYGDSNYSLIKVDCTKKDADGKDKEEIEFQLYGTQSVLAPRDLPNNSTARAILRKLKGYFSEEKSINHSIAKIPLNFEVF